MAKIKLPKKLKNYGVIRTSDWTSGSTLGGVKVSAAWSQYLITTPDRIIGEIDGYDLERLYEQITAVVKKVRNEQQAHG